MRETNKNVQHGGLLLLVVLLVVVVGVVDGVPVYVMLPLDTVTSHGVPHRTQLQSDFDKLKAGGVTGVMTDVWWGLVEAESPHWYNWTAYEQLFADVARAGLKLQVVMSFHKCGGNVGDNCDIPLPAWARATAGDAVFYKDAHGHVDDEALSMSVDNRPVIGDKNGGEALRSGLQVYHDFMESFAQQFAFYLGNTNNNSASNNGEQLITQVAVGMGAASELRYPSYQLSQWSYCGVGEFQCYDDFMLQDLQAAATAAGHSEWGHGGPNSAGSYKSHPADTQFFADNKGGENYASAYGRFFLGWYSATLLAHGRNVLKQARDAFGPSVTLGVKVSGIHWWYGSTSHAAELTAGYYNADGHDAYGEIADMLKSSSDGEVEFDFTCLEMWNAGDCGSRPEELVKQAANAAYSRGVPFTGENGLERCDPTCDTNSLNHIVQVAANMHLRDFTYLRLTRSLLDNSNNWVLFRSFVSSMNNIH